MAEFPTAVALCRFPRISIQRLRQIGRSRQNEAIYLERATNIPGVGNEHAAFPRTTCVFLELPNNALIFRTI